MQKKTKFRQIDLPQTLAHTDPHTCAQTQLVCTRNQAKHTHACDTCTHTHPHGPTRTSGTDTLVCVHAAHSPCLGLPDAMVCALPAEVVRLKLLPSPPGQLRLRLPLPTRTGSGLPGGLDNCRVSFGSQQWVRRPHPAGPIGPRPSGTSPPAPYPAVCVLCISGVTCTWVKGLGTAGTRGRGTFPRLAHSYCE